MIHLDTHVVVWLYTDRVDRLPKTARRLIEREEVGYSPMLVLELAYLHEVGRLTDEPQSVMGALTPALELQQSTAPFASVVAHAQQLTWTRDPFDRLIAANAAVDGATLVTADQTMLREAPHSVWD